jgi:beta-N-acetylhexosaminidase
MEAALVAYNNDRSFQFRRLWRVTLAVGTLVFFLVIAGQSTAFAATSYYQENNSALIYSGVWNSSLNASASSGSFRYANTPGSSVTVYFEGTSLTWIAKMSSVYGKAQVTLDDKAAVTVDLYSATTLWRQNVWNTGTLAYGYHRVIIAWTGTKDQVSSGTNVNVDAFGVDGTLVRPSHLEQTDTRLSYTGSWTTPTSTSASGGSFAFANSQKSSVTIKFSGTYLSWTAKKSPVYGRANVSLDGGTPTTVDLYSATTVWQRQVWHTPWLTSGSHSVTISWTGTKSSSATNTYINTDSFDVVGATQDAVPPKSMLSPAQIAGERVIYSYSGLTPPASLLDAIRHGEVAGIIFFGGNISSDSQLASVTAELKEANASSTNPFRAPLLLMTDQEGGQVRRLPGAPTLSEKQIGESADPSAEATSAGTGAAQNLRSVGLNVNLAPVLDVYRAAGDFDDKYGRSYSSDHTLVATLGADFITAQQKQGVAATAKHFPGLGDATASQNTDAGPVTLNLSLDSIRSIDEAPYQSAIAAKVKLIMVSWAIYPELAPGEPAGLSSTIVQGELRQRLGFTGVTITDALEAGAISSLGSTGQLAVRAAGAGMDLILCSKQDTSQGQAAATALQADYTSGALNQTNFQTSVQRVMDLRYGLGG